MFLTVGITVFNEETRLPAMLGSLEAQDWSLFEVRFSDDGSTDRTEDVVREFAQRHPGKVFYERHGNMGPGLSRNRIIPQAKGEYLWFCDGDDAIVPQAISAMAHCLEGMSYDIVSFLCGSGGDSQTALNSVPIPLTRSQAVQCISGATCAKILKTEFLRQNSILFPETRIGEDLVFSLRATCFAQTACFWYEKPYCYIRRQASLSSDLDDRFMDHMARSIACMDRQAEEFPEFRLEIQYRSFQARWYVLRRLEDDGTPEMKERYADEAWDGLKELVDRHENPLLRSSFRLISRNRSMGRKLQREQQKARQREQRLEKDIQAMEKSLSWRLTSPLRALGRILSHKNS